MARHTIRHLSLAMSTALLVAACGDDGGTQPAEDTSAGADTAEVVDTVEAADTSAVADTTEAVDTVAPPAAIASQSYPAPEPWSEPIADYLTIGQQEVGSLGFERGVHDLARYEGRLYLGYGDATANLGRVFPIDFRSFRDPADPTATQEFLTDEEQLDRYRYIDGDLWMAGVDATEDAWLGNVFRRGPDSGWEKLRTVQNGVHVHDVGGFGGAVYAVGSGGTPEEWGAGDIYGHLWRSEDLGQSWEIVHRHHNGGDGDARYTRLLPLAGGLYLFGYASNAEFLIDELSHGVWDGEAFTALPAEHPLMLALVIETDPVTADLGLVRAKDFSVSPAVQRMYWLDGSDGAVTPITSFADQTVVDVDVVEETGEILALTVDGSDWAPGGLGDVQVRAWVTTADAPEGWTQVFALQTATAPKSLAWWRGGLYLGTWTGEVWRSLPE